ncbi:lipopolysaccharide heptosyltransferase I [Polynucleobacter sp. MWH-UH2A]|uniref:lipopolysaccharide heptosyltransferase I n=1 Tax=Polynucleobacter sp. MWH-UH2A TaxID=1855617 RepID=UPI001BFE1CCE|nr:lipopolysaccharide heptosyltransferase I [Polynucleobacter sp. MWH-UH2A]QWD64307.1 lipopolysaccharide heptosyltransferase I [Polynucleobacter sp. MWH-UH2A]
MNNPIARPKILLVKLSSLGDVLHNLPIVWDMRSRIPDAQIDWVVEEAYVNLLTPLLSRDGFRGIDRIIPFGLRRWKKSLLSTKSWREFFAFKNELQAANYDIIIETQGLLKSALVCGLAKKNPEAIVAGLANATEFSGYEPIARAFYSQSVQVPLQCHAVDRARYVMCSALDWPLIGRDEGVQFYRAGFEDSFGNSQLIGLKQPYILFFHSTAREAKRWANTHWVDLGIELSKLGYQVVLPWGNTSEKLISDMLASQIPGSIVPSAFSIEEAFLVIANSSLVVGVDTGLTHLAAVLNKPTVEIYCDSPRWKTEGYWSDKIRNIGDMKKPPEVKEALDASLELLNAVKN